MNPTELLRAYYVAAIRTQYGHRCIGWSDAEVLESYAFCDTPSVPIEEWAKLAQINVTLGDDDLSDQLMREHNTEALKGLPSFATEGDPNY